MTCMHAPSPSFLLEIGLITQFLDPNLHLQVFNTHEIEGEFSYHTEQKKFIFLVHASVPHMYLFYQHCVLYVVSIIVDYLNDLELLLWDYGYSFSHVHTQSCRKIDTRSIIANNAYLYFISIVSQSRSRMLHIFDICTLHRYYT